MRQKFNIAVILILTISGCTPISHLGIQEFEKEDLSKADYKKLNGIYHNYPDTASGHLEQFPYPRSTKHLSLFNQFVIGQWGGKEEIIRLQKIKIEFENQNKAKVTLMDEYSEVLATKHIKGRFKDGYFYSRPKKFIIPLIPLLFGYYADRFRLGIRGDNLTIDYSVKKWMAGFVVGESSKGYYSSIYMKID